MRTGLDLLDLPPAPAPAGAYLRGRILGGVGALSGQFPIADGRLAYIGRVGGELTLADGQAAAALAARNVVAALRATLDDELERRLVGLLRVEGHVASAPGFYDQPATLDAASRELAALLGARGAHARAAFAPERLPLNAPVELVVTFVARA